LAASRTPSFFPHFILPFSSPPTLPSLPLDTPPPPPHLPPHPHRHTSGFRKGKSQEIPRPVKNAHTHHTTHTHTHTHNTHRALLPLRFKCRRIAYLVARMRRGVDCKAEARALAARTQTLYANTSKHLATLVSSLVDVFPFNCALALRATLTARVAATPYSIWTKFLLLSFLPLSRILTRSFLSIHTAKYCCTQLTLMQSRPQ
jgi:hypothetical protein